MAKKFTIYGAFLLLLLAGYVVFFLNRSTQNTNQTTNDKSIKRNLDFFSIGYSRVELNAKGEPKNELLADKLMRYYGDATVTLDNVAMKTFSTEQEFWQINAKNGRLLADNDLFLTGNVYISRTEISGQRNVKIKTNNLQVKADQNYAQTDSWVEILTPLNSTKAVGMQIYFADSMYLKLLSNVRSKYELH